jgi:cyanophycinase-like exopeptidase
VSRLVVMGSGETTPTMVRVHREVFAACPAGPAVMLDTPFAFQMNRAELVTRTRSYFAQSVGREVEVAAWSGREDPATAGKSLALLDRAAWAFAGPGSPTYALRHWRGTPVPAALAGVVRRGGTLVLGSAAALTLGSHAVPVYEIYKVGADPEWVDGLDLLGELTGVAAAVVPHYDNKEGATHDTRFCYLGEERLTALEAALPDEVGVLGVDEHTAMLVDVEARTMTVAGNGVVSVRRRGDTRTFAAGESLTLDALSAMLRGEQAAAPAPAPAAAATPVAAAAPVEVDAPATSLRAEADRAREAFEAALGRRDVDGCVAAVLGLEEAIAAWQADTLQSDDADEARRVLRALVVRLGELAEQGAADPAEAVAPFVEALLAVRTGARENKDFATSDLVRDRLVAAGVEVRDAPDGTSWTLAGS